MGVIYLDFAKAFNAVGHDILLRKVKALGIEGKVGRWLYSFLHDRKQSVCVSGVNSNASRVISGVEWS